MIYNKAKRNYTGFGIFILAVVFITYVMSDGIRYHKSILLIPTMPAAPPVPQVTIPDFDSSFVKSVEVKTHAQAWMMQLGSFTKEKNALSLREHLQRGGFAAYVKPEKIAKRKTVFRVMAGPFQSKQKALLAKNKIVTKFNLQGIIYSKTEG